ncbi:MAG: FAD binding domain-containing protein [Armatimonadota bacterium]|nr:FAD binding domain-containing protein [Armatimonadota bacterium]MDR7519711.1 FAD binding domain-containing protein [Armatimonadota bacterium]MDR7549143.1 FAD binding domain-containing protein [Armatimonadota bacterium]
MIPAAFDYAAPKTLDEALRLLRRHRDARLLAGGQSLLSVMKLRAATPKMVVDLGRIRGLAYIKETAGTLLIGAMTTHEQIASSALVWKRARALAEAAEQIGDIQVRNRGTIGGSLAHADPAADYPAAFLALEGVAVVKGPGRQRTIPADGFFTGLFATALKPGEILTEVRIPLKPAIIGSAYRKMKHPASGFAIVGAAAVLRAGSKGQGSQVRLAFTGAAAHAFRAKAVEAALAGQAITEAAVKAAMERATEGVEMLEDLAADAAYRAHLVRVYGARALLAAGAG